MKTLVRTNSYNRVLRDICVKENTALASLYVDQTHSFFYDHPLDHVPGLLLIEGALQLAYEWARSNGFIRLCLRRVRVRFVKYCLHGTPVIIDLRAEAKLNDAHRLSIELVQADGVKARVQLDLGEFEPVPVELHPRVPQEPSPAPAPKTRLGKINPSNVMIVEPEVHEHGWLSRLRICKGENLLADPPKDRFWHPLYLLEAYMQLLRFQNSDPAQEHGSGRMRDILQGIDYRIFAHADRAQHIWLQSELQPKGLDRSLVRHGLLFDDKKTLANVDFSTARAQTGIRRPTITTLTASG